MNNTPYAGFWRRTFAFIVDMILLSIPPAIICVPLIFMTLGAIPQTEENLALAVAGVTGWILVWNALQLVSFWLYFAFLESGKKQATFGKRLMGIKVVGSEGQRIGFGRATGRAFSKVLSYTIMWIGFIMVALTNRKRALHDYIADTYVVSASFQPGDALPDTPKHTGWLITLIVLASLLFVGWMVISIASSSGIGETIAAQQASARLQQIAQERPIIQEPVEEGAFTYFHNIDGFRAVRNPDDQYTLYLPMGQNTVCCEVIGNETCPVAGFPNCD